MKKVQKWIKNIFKAKCDYCKNTDAKKYLIENERGLHDLIHLCKNCARSKNNELSKKMIDKFLPIDEEANERIEKYFDQLYKNLNNKEYQQYEHYE